MFSVIYWSVFSDTLGWLVNSWSNNPFYSHGYILVGLSLVVIVLNAVKIKSSLSIRSSRISMVSTVCAAVLIITGTVIRFHYLISAGYLFVLLGISGFTVETKKILYILRPLFVILIALPVPFFYDISGYFCFLTLKVSASVLSWIFPSIMVNGVEITIPPDVSFQIGMNCSGANSIFALMSVIVLGVVITVNSLRNTLILLAAAVPAGFVSNVMRILFIFIIARIWGMDAAVKVWHGFGGYLFYILSLAIMIGLWAVISRDTGLKYRKLVMDE